TPYEPWLLHQLAIHPKFVGGKVSTLDEPHFLGRPGPFRRGPRGRRRQVLGAVDQRLHGDDTLPQR
ncbi:MAG: hypothetical protein EBZ91_12125, partial [Gammaproteobacteria bacterium]|nr:hypothetical protein [Gammaproteobacteria bacterium]